MPLSTDTITKLKSAHGDDLHLFTSGGHELVLKAPGRDLWTKFKRTSQEPARRAQALEHLVTDCIVHPERDAVVSLIDRRPGLVDTVGEKLAELAGLDERASLEKL